MNTKNFQIFLKNSQYCLSSPLFFICCTSSPTKKRSPSFFSLNEVSVALCARSDFPIHPRCSIPAAAVPQDPLADLFTTSYLLKTIFPNIDLNCLQGMEGGREKRLTHGATHVSATCAGKTTHAEILENTQDFWSENIKKKDAEFLNPQQQLVKITTAYLCTHDRHRLCG